MSSDSKRDAAPSSSSSFDLTTYREKLDFNKTNEPIGEAPTNPNEPLRFVVQKHEARRLHYVRLSRILSQSWNVCSISILSIFNAIHHSILNLPAIDVGLALRVICASPACDRIFGWRWAA